MTALQQAAADLKASFAVRPATNLVDRRYSPYTSLGVVLTVCDANTAISNGFFWNVDRRTRALNEAVANGVVFG